MPVTHGRTSIVVALQPDSTARRLQPPPGRWSVRHSATSLALFSCRLTLGLARVRLSRSDATPSRVSAWPSVSIAARIPVRSSETHMELSFLLFRLLTVVTLGVYGSTFLLE